MEENEYNVVDEYTAVNEYNAAYDTIDSLPEEGYTGAVVDAAKTYITSVNTYVSSFASAVNETISSLQGLFDTYNSNVRAANNAHRLDDFHKNAYENAVKNHNDNNCSKDGNGEYVCNCQSIIDLHLNSYKEYQAQENTEAGNANNVCEEILSKCGISVGCADVVYFFLPEVAKDEIRFSAVNFNGAVVKYGEGADNLLLAVSNNLKSTINNLLESRVRPRSDLCYTINSNSLSELYSLCDWVGGKVGEISAKMADFSTKIYDYFTKYIEAETVESDIINSYDPKLSFKEQSDDFKKSSAAYLTALYEFYGKDRDAALSAYYLLIYNKCIENISPTYSTYQAEKDAFDIAMNIAVSGDWTIQHEIEGNLQYEVDQDGNYVLDENGNLKPKMVTPYGAKDYFYVVYPSIDKETTTTTGCIGLINPYDYVYNGDKHVYGYINYESEGKLENGVIQTVDLNEESSEHFLRPAPDIWSITADGFTEGASVTNVKNLYGGPEEVDSYFKEEAKALIIQEKIKADPSFQQLSEEAQKSQITDDEVEEKVATFSLEKQLEICKRNALIPTVTESKTELSGDNWNANRDNRPNAAWTRQLESINIDETTGEFVVGMKELTYNDGAVYPDNTPKTAEKDGIVKSYEAGVGTFSYTRDADKPYNYDELIAGETKEVEIAYEEETTSKEDNDDDDNDDEDPIIIPGPIEPGPGKPGPECGINQKVENGQCVDIQCGINQKVENGQCVDIQCDINQKVENGQCVDIQCGINQKVENGQCVDIQCPAGTKFNEETGDCEADEEGLPEVDELGKFDSIFFNVDETN